MNAIDTNVFVYAIQASEPLKATRAAEILAARSPDDTVLPWQVLCEFSAVLEKLRRSGRSTADPIVVTNALKQRYPLIFPNPSVHEEALDLCRKKGLAFWDGLLIAACAAAGVTTLYSEDVPGAQMPGGIRVVNPFAT